MGENWQIRWVYSAATVKLYINDRLVGWIWREGDWWTGQTDRGVPDTLAPTATEAQAIDWLKDMGRKMCAIGGIQPQPEPVAADVE